jgi:NTE family protein
MSEQAAGENKQVTHVDLVFQGGGVKGIGLVGAYSVLEERGYQPMNMAGASAGAIVAALIATGYSANDLYHVMRQLDLTEFQDKRWKGLLPDILHYPLAVLLYRGFFKGDEFYRWIKEKLGENDLGEELTFGDLRRNDLAEGYPPVYYHKVQVIVSDITGGRLVVLPRDADKLGWDDPDRVPVALAVRMSMSFPFFFEPVRRPVPTDNGAEHLIIDGGMLSNFPVWLFDAPEGAEAKRKTYGLKLITKDTRKPIMQPGSSLIVPDAEVPERQERLTTVRYMSRMVSTMMEASDRLYIEQKKFATTISIPTLGVGTMDFKMSDKLKDRLYESGRKEAEEFLDKPESGTSPAETPSA